MKTREKFILSAVLQRVAQSAGKQSLVKKVNTFIMADELVIINEIIKQLEKELDEVTN